MNLHGALRTTVLAAALVMASTASAHASEWGDGVDVILDEEMDDLRGGFEINGMQIGFGAVVTSYMNGAPVLTTQLTWTDAGAMVEQTMANVGQRLEDMTPEARSALGVDGLDQASGIVITDEAGVTAMVHNITDGALQNIIINSATGRDLAQDIDVTLTLPGFDAIQDSLVLERFGMRLSDDIAGGLVIGN
jgi:hypothetical protein